MEQPELLTAKENAAVKQYRKLTRQKKERQQQGQFVLEGIRLVADALQNGADCVRLFLTQAAWERYADRFAALRLTGARLNLVSEELADFMSETEHPQGAFAICRMPKTPPLETLLQRGSAYLILNQVQDPGNLGMMLRTADAFGAEAVICVQSCDPYAPKTVRSAMGSLLRVPVVQEPELSGVLQACAQQGVVTCAAVLHAPDSCIAGRDSLPQRAAIVIGNEGNGLSEAEASACARRVTIPMHGAIESLNAAMAAGILLWELVRTRGTDKLGKGT